MKKNKPLLILLLIIFSTSFLSCNKENIYMMNSLEKELLIDTFFGFTYKFSSITENIHMNTINKNHSENVDIIEAKFDNNYELLGGYLPKNAYTYEVLCKSDKYVPGGNNSDLFNSFYSNNLYSYEIKPNEITLYSFNNDNPTIEYADQILLFVMYRIGYTINNERKYLCIDITDEFFENDLKYDNSYDSYINNKLITPVTYLPSIITFSNEETLLKHFIRVYKENGKEYIKTSNLNSSSYEKFKDAIVNENNSTGELTLNYKIIKKILEI